MATALPIDHMDLKLDRYDMRPVRRLGNVCQPRSIQAATQWAINRHPDPGNEKGPESKRHPGPTYFLPNENQGCRSTR